MVVILPYLTACSGYGGSSRDGGRITITSSPPGATILAEGNEIGTTPMRIRPGEFFPTRFTSGDGESEGIITLRYVGTLALKKDGCRTYSTQVNDYILSRDISVPLECSPGHHPDTRAGSEPQPTVTGTQPVPAAATTRPSSPSQPAVPVQDAGPVSDKDASQRLRQIELLYEQGLLSDEEYVELRKRVLDTL